MNAIELQELLQHADRIEQLQRERSGIAKPHKRGFCGSTQALRDAERIARLIRQAVKELEAGGAR